jgi:hypothetical protein
MLLPDEPRGYREELHMVIAKLTSGRYGDLLGLADEEPYAAERINAIENEDGLLEIIVGRGSVRIFRKTLPALC